MSLLHPNAVVSSLSGIDLEDYWKKGKRGIILDLDNTITPWHQDALTKEAVDLVAQARSLTYKIYLLSNASYARTRKVAEQLAVDFTAPGFKPLRRGYKIALKKMGLPPEQVLVIGDQIFTDVWGGNRAGCYTILVTPLEKKEFFWTKFMRLLELLVGRQTP